MAEPLGSAFFCPCALSRAERTLGAMRESQHPRRRMTLDEYLAFEEESPMRHEYVAGEVYAMSGPTTRHNTISLNIHRHLHTPARRRGCRVFVEAIKLHVLDRVYYPDVMIACGGAPRSN